MKKLVDPLYNITASVEATVSPISQEKMVALKVNGTPVWAHLGDRICIPMTEEEASKLAKV